MTIQFSFREVEFNLVDALRSWKNLTKGGKMLVRYVCEYCGTVHRSKRAVSACENKAKTLQPKFKSGNIVCDQDGYRYEVLRTEKWRMDFDKVLKKIMAEEYEDLNIPMYEHTFVCVLQALDSERKDEMLETSLLPYVKLEKPLPLKKKGIMVEDEKYLNELPPEEILKDV